MGVTRTADPENEFVDLGGDFFDHVVVAVVVGLEPTDIEPSHTLGYHGSIYKVGESW
jgi:hypothetical protein